MGTGKQPRIVMDTEKQPRTVMDTEKLPLIVEPLLAWFGENARALPWREHPTPYYVWVSEIMLQQTRVEAVKPYFARFTAALPDIAALAGCQQERLLKLWRPWTACPPWR